MLRLQILRTVKGSPQTYLSRYLCPSLLLAYRYKLCFVTPFRAWYSMFVLWSPSCSHVIIYIVRKNYEDEKQSAAQTVLNHFLMGCLSYICHRWDIIKDSLLNMLKWGWLLENYSCRCVFYFPALHAWEEKTGRKQ